MSQVTRCSNNQISSISTFFSFSLCCLFFCKHIIFTYLHVIFNGRAVKYAFEWFDIHWTTCTVYYFSLGKRIHLFVYVYNTIVCTLIVPILLNFQHLKGKIIKSNSTDAADELKILLMQWKIKIGKYHNLLNSNVWQYQDKN